MRRLAGSVPSCPHLQFREPPVFLREDPAQDSRRRSSSVIPALERLRSLHFGRHRAREVSVHAAYRIGLDVCKDAYIGAPRPCRSDLIARLAAGLVSVARSGAIPDDILADTMLPVFDRWVDPALIHEALEALLSACEALPPFANPGLGAVLCTALVSQLVELEHLSEDALADVLRPCLFTVMVVTTGSLYDNPHAGAVVADGIPYATTQVTDSRRGIFRLTTTFAPLLRTTLGLPLNRMDIEVAEDTINALASILLVDSPPGHRVVHPTRLSILAESGHATLALPTRALLLEPGQLPDLQHTMLAHVLDLPWRAWADHRAIQWGDI